MCQDFGFREAISSRDKATIESMLSNHSKRANVSVSILSDLEQTIIATSPITITLDSKFTSQIATNISAAQGNLNFIPLNLSNPQSLQSKYAETAKFSKIYQLISTPVLSPLHSATLTLGFPIDNAYAQELKDVINMDFLFFPHENGVWQLHASTLNAKDAQLFTPHTFDTQQIDSKTEQYLSMPIKLHSSSNKMVIAVAAKPMSKLMQPFTRFENVLIYLLLITISLSAIVIYFVTSKMVRPLNELAHTDNLTGLGNRRLFNLMPLKSCTALKTIFVNSNGFKLIQTHQRQQRSRCWRHCVASHRKAVKRNAQRFRHSDSSGW